MDNVRGYRDNAYYQDGSGYQPYGGEEYGEESPYPAESPVYPESQQYQDSSRDYQYDNGGYGDEYPYPDESGYYQDAGREQAAGLDYQYEDAGNEADYQAYENESGEYYEDYAGELWWEDARIATALIWLTHIVNILGIALGIFGIVSGGGPMKDWAFRGIHFAVPLMVGAAGILSFFRYSVFHASDAKRSGENPEESFFQKEAGFANLAIGIMALFIFFGGWGTGTEVAIALIYAIYSSLALVFTFLHEIEYYELDRRTILHMVIWLISIGFLFFFSFAAASPMNLSPF